MKQILLVAALLLTVCACAQESPQHTVVQIEGMASVVLPPLPEKLDLAGEVVPLEYYDVRESLQRELLTTMYLHSRTVQTLIATTRYFPVIESILKKNGVPDDMKYLCMAESGLDPNVVSSAGAGGLWQLMPPYAKSAGLEMGGGVDFRFHLEQSTEAACKYLLEAKAKFGSWAMAAASYNAGMAGVSKRMTTQGVSSYYDLFLPQETMRYVYRILAFKLITESPESYGFQISPDQLMKPLSDYKEVTVSGVTIDWSAVAKEYGTNYKMLRELNHWIRDYDYTGKTERKFTLRIPNAGFRK